jgi:mannose-6-phosphate isomerase-like protein (cupin superfamily)
MSEKHEKILSLQSELSTRLETKYREGFVSNIPYTTEPIEIQDGWKIKSVIEREDIDGWIENVDPGGSLPDHSHPNKSELSIVISGELKYEIKDKTKILSSGDSIYVPCGVEHSVEDVSEAGSKMLVIYEPPIGVNVEDNN